MYLIRNNILFFGLIILSCNLNNEPQKSFEVYPNYPILEMVKDSLKIGNKGKSKTEINLYRTDESDSVSLKFFAKKNKVWILKNNYSFKHNGLRGLDLKVLDLNNDGKLDFHYNSLEAARGANDVRKLFIYSPEFDSLIHIKNSERFPNLRYNKELDCIDALLVSGSFTTVFLKLDNDSLIEFASVDIADRILVSETNEAGKEIILIDTINTFGYFERFENYKPLKVLNY